MTTLKKSNANRANARKSTGPKTTPGKFRSAQNARRHGFGARPIIDPLRRAEVEALADKIAGANATATVKMLAQHVAEAQIELCRIRKTRHDLISACLADPEYEPVVLRKTKMKYLLRFARGRALLDPAPDYVIAALSAKIEGPQKLAAIAMDLAPNLAAMNRYEQRALSRRKFAIRALDAERLRSKM